MKKYLSLLSLTLLALFALAACSLFETATPPERGVWRGDVFESQHLGLRFTLPNSWEMATDAEIALIEHQSAPLAEMGNDDFTDMMAVNHWTGGTVRIMYERLRGRFTNMDSFLQLTAEHIEGMGIAVNIDFPSTVRIGSYDWHVVGTEFRAGGMTTFSRQFITVQRGFIYYIVINYYDHPSEDVETMLSFFSDLSSPAPAPQLASELVGNWLWDEDYSYIYNFNADGTGLRGFPWFIEEFDWRVINVPGEGNRLIIDGEEIAESWRYSLSGGVLTMDGITFDEMYSYVPDYRDMPRDAVNNYFAGTWVWDEDDTFIYTFNADGNGVLNYVPHIEDERFTWLALADGRVLMFGDEWVDVWFFELDGDILQLTDATNPMFVYTYIRTN